MADNSNWDVFCAVRDAKTATRATIARLTGLSLMTVGKVTDRLERAKILVRVKQKENDGSAGRRPSIYRLNRKPFVMVADATGDCTRVWLYDVGGHSIGLPFANGLYDDMKGFFGKDAESVVLTAVVAADGKPEPYDVFPEAPYLFVSGTTAAAWDVYYETDNESVLYVGKPSGRDWIACFVADGEVKPLRHGGMRTLISVTGDVQNAIAAMIVSLSPERVMIDTDDARSEVIADSLLSVIPEPPSIEIYNDSAFRGADSGAAALAVYKYISSLA